MKKSLATVVLMVFTAAAFAQGPGGMGMGPGPGPNCDMPCDDGPRGIAGKMNLTEDQQGQMDKMRIDVQKKQTAVHSKIRIAELEMQELYGAPSPDRNAIEKKMKEILDLELQMKMIQLDHQFSVRGILTSEQQKVWKQHMKFMGKGRSMRHRMMDRDMNHGMRGPEERIIERRIEKKVEKDVK
jgi:Spy/CpxP family protein refolding chaperone